MSEDGAGNQWGWPGRREVLGGLKWGEKLVLPSTESQQFQESPSSIVTFGSPGATASIPV